jgi:hypothetical protein
MHCDLTIRCDTPEELAHVASAVAAATGRGAERPERRGSVGAGLIAALRAVDEWTAGRGDESTLDPLARRLRGLGIVADEVERHGATYVAKCLLQDLDEKPAPAAQATPLPGPTARDAVAGMLLRFGFGWSSGVLANGFYTPEELALRLKTERAQLPKADACIAALEALAAREACRAGHGVDDVFAECAPGEQVEIAVSAHDRERLGMVVHDVICAWWTTQGITAPPPWKDISEAKRERDRCIGEQLFAMGLTAGRAGAKEEREALRKRVEELEFTRDELTGILRDVRAALGIQRGGSVTDAAAKIRMERDDLRERVAGLEAEKAHRAASAFSALDEAREHGAAEMRERAASLVLNWEPWEPLTKLVEATLALPLAPTPGASEVAPAKRIERRADGEWLVGPGSERGCRASGPGGVCTYHHGGEHIATYPDDGAEKILARWPIAPVKLARVECGSVWLCVGLESLGDLEVLPPQRPHPAMPEHDVALAPVGTTGDDKIVHARAADMLGLSQWTFVRGPEQCTEGASADIRAAHDVGGGP